MAGRRFKRLATCNFIFFTGIKWYAGAIFIREVFKVSKRQQLQSFAEHSFTLNMNIRH